MRSGKLARGVVILLPAVAIAASSSSGQPAESEKEELAARRTCKIATCAALHNRNPGPDVSCNLTRSWRKDQLEKVVSKAKVAWPWEGVRCHGQIRLSRDQLAKAVSEPRYEAAFERQAVACQIDRGTENTEITLEFTPKVTFENGKAVKASVNWGKIEAPSMVRNVLWTATVADNTFNVLQSNLVQEVNEFIGVKCEELKSEWEGK